MPIETNTPVPLATITIVHSSALVGAGLASMLRLSPEFDVRLGPGDSIAVPRESRAPVHIVVGDPTGVERMAAHETLWRAWTEGTATKVVLLTAASDAAPVRAIGPLAIDESLSVDCQPEDLQAALHRLCVPAHPRWAGGRPSRSTPRGGLAPGALRRVREHIHGRLAQRIDLNELASIAGLSDCHFSRAFKQSVGVPPHRYVVMRRIEAAAALIEQTDRPLCEIALEVGFSDQSHFTRIFSRLVRQTPREYRHGRR